MLMTSAFFQFVTFTERKFSIKMETLVLILLGQTAGALNNTRDTCDYLMSGHKKLGLHKRAIIAQFPSRAMQVHAMHNTTRDQRDGAASHGNLSLLAYCMRNMNERLSLYTQFKLHSLQVCIFRYAP
jgi:hypothetical protein